MKILLTRFENSKYGTFGRLSFPGFSCFTAEPPWKDNKQNLSCIPLGTYKALIVKSLHFGLVYSIVNVPKRSNVLFHSGNFAGDIELGLITHTHGCVLLGSKIGVLSNQKAILLSVVAKRKFWNFLKEQEFELNITSSIEGFL